MMAPAMNAMTSGSEMSSAPSSSASATADRTPTISMPRMTPNGLMRAT